MRRLRRIRHVNKKDRMSDQTTPNIHNSKTANPQSRVPIVVLATLALLAAPSLEAEILKVEIEGAIDPVEAAFIQKAIEEAGKTDAEFLLIRLATPGGLGISMQEIIQGILNSPVPVVCWVGPKGHHAASAGFFILLSADVAAMAPGTNTGAAHPVFPFGMENEVMLEKVRNDALANLRSIVENRNRNYEMARDGVLESRSYTETEALDGGLIDLIAENEAELLSQLEGREITRFSGEKQRLTVQGQPIRRLEKNLRERILSAIASPNISLLLGLIGLLGLYLEFTTPGAVVPGVVGGICLLLALIGFSLLPINYVGVLLILLALGLLVAEVLVQGFGILGLGGIVSLVLGLLLLVDSPYPELRIGLGYALAVAVPFAVAFLVLVWIVVRNLKTRAITGREGLEGLVGKTRTPVDPSGGKVFVHSEWWNAVSEQPIEPGREVRVVRVENNMTLVVEPVHSSPPGAGRSQPAEDHG